MIFGGIPNHKPQQRISFRACVGVIPARLMIFVCCNFRSPFILRHKPAKVWSFFFFSCIECFEDDLLMNLQNRIQSTKESCLLTVASFRLYSRKLYSQISFSLFPASLMNARSIPHGDFGRHLHTLRSIHAGAMCHVKHFRKNRWFSAAQTARPFSFKVWFNS